MNIKQSIMEATKRLKESNIDEAFNIARILMAYVLDKPKEYLIANDKQNLDNDIIVRYNANIKKIKNGYPLQYITHNQEFMKLNFYVDENVLIPQPDTEILVEQVLEIYKKEYVQARIKILDICTGSGAIAIAIKKYINNSEVVATDISYKALEVANKNAKINNVEIKFVQSDMFKDIIEKFDVIVSNPPYIERKMLNQLPEDVKKEPIQALDGGADGLDFYREISKMSYKYLNKNGYLALEIGYNQKETVTDILKNEGKYANIKCIKDLAGNDRVIIAKII